MKVKEVMNKAIAVDHDITLKQASKIMSDKNIGSLVAIKNGMVVGILTERDILKNISNVEKPIYSIMSKKVYTIDSEDDLDNAAITLTKYKIKRLPVIGKDGRLMGIITSTDLIAHSDELNEDFLFD
jgi:CBS domain-containing protein